MLLQERVDRLVERGVPEVAGLSPEAFRRLADGLPTTEDVVVAVHPDLVAASRLAGLLRRGDKPGFVVADLTDLDDFVPRADLVVPDRPLYLLRGVVRGDDLRSWSPDEALPEIVRRGRTPLTIGEALSWLLQEPEQLQPNHCFMAIGSRKPRGRALDARTPAVWISGGTGHDGRERRNAPNVGWCWAGNRHTWLGIASVQERLPPPGRPSVPPASG